MNFLEKLIWILAEIRADPQRLFVLWAIGVRLCHSVEEFRQQFDSELQSAALIESLLVDGFLISTEGLLHLTPLGEMAIEILKDKRPSQSASKGGINIGVVRVGYCGFSYVRNFYSLPNCTVRAMCDVSEERVKHMRSLYPDVEGMTNVEQLLFGWKLDAVVVATPVQYHYHLAKESLLSGKHTLIAEPMASSSAECEELMDIAASKGLVLMIGHTFLYSPVVRKIVDIIQAGDIGDIRYINSRRLNLGLFEKDMNVAWDLAPHDISIFLHILEEFPVSVNCQGNAHVTPHIADVTNMSLFFRHKRFATIQSSWLEPRKVREMTIVGTRRMIVYDDLQKLEKIRIYDIRVERPPPGNVSRLIRLTDSDTFGDCYIPHIEQEEPLKLECQHFLECIEKGSKPLTGGRQGLEVVKILEAASDSLEKLGAPVTFSRSETGRSLHSGDAKEIVGRKR